MRTSNKYDFQVNTYQTTQRVEVARNCNGITFTNIGDTIVTVEGMVLYPGTVGTILGDSRTIGGNEGEILHKKQIVVTFATGGAAPNIEIIQKYYVD